MRELAQQDLPCGGRCTRDEAKRFFGTRGEALKVQLIDEKTEGQDTVSCYTIKDKETFVDFCVGPHVPSPESSRRSRSSTPECLLEGRRAQSADAHLRERRSSSDKELQEHLHRLEEAKKRSPPHRPRSEAVHVPSLGARRAVLAGQGNDALRTPRAACAASCCPRGSWKWERRSSSTRGCGRRPGTGSTTARTCSRCRAPTKARRCSRR